MKFVHYHIPMYPSCKKGPKDTRVQNEGRDLWVPLFDKHKVTAGLENHVHGFKKTHLLKGGKKVESDGTYYLGDGSWGALKPSCTAVNQDVIESENLFNHVWFINVNIPENKVSYKAVTPTGESLADFY